MTNPLSRVGANSGILTVESPSVFDLAPGWAQQNMSFVFTLIDGSTGQVLRTLHPTASNVPQLSHDITRTVKRQLNLTLRPNDTSAVNPLTQRVRVAMLLGDGSSYPLGKYIFTDQTNTRYTSGVYSDVTLMDEEYVMDQPLDVSFPPPAYSITISNPSGSNTQPRGVDAVARGLMLNYPQISYDFEQSPYFSSGSWGFGSTGMQVLSDLATFGDFFAPWIGHDELLHMIRTFDPSDRVPDFDWDRYPHVFAEGVSETSDVLVAPNRYVVVSNTTSVTSDTTPTVPATISGSYDVPASAPYSKENRGFIIPFIAQMQLDTPLQANAVARTIGIQSTIFDRTALDTWPDPRHDSHNVIWWRGQRWLELAWTMDLVAGGKMSHVLRKVYTT